MSFLNDVVNIVIKYYPNLLDGVGNTMLIALIGTVAGLVIGLLTGVVRTAPLSKNAVLRVLHKMHPEIPCVSEEEEAELEVEYERRRAEERRRPPLSMRAEREIEELENAIAYLER